MDEANATGKRVYRFYLLIVSLAAFGTFVFCANQPVVDRFRGDGDEVCSTNLSADDYQTCLVITDEGHPFG